MANSPSLSGVTVDPWNMADMFFHSSATRWMGNKNEVFDGMGSSGSFEYSNTHGASCAPMKSSDLGISGSVHPTQAQQPRFSHALRNHIASADVVMSLVGRRSIYLSSKSRPAEKTSKELSSIREQTIIPIYMDGFSRPPRKCRIISS